MRVALPMLGAVMAGLAVGCAGGGPGVPADLADGGVVDAVRTDGALVYDCLGVEGTAEQFEAGPDLASVRDHPAHDVVLDAVHPTGWSVLEVGPARVAAVRALTTRERVESWPRSHAQLVVEPIDGAEPAAALDWKVVSHTTCNPRVQLRPDLWLASVAIDPAAEPDATSEELRLLVRDNNCGDGEPPDGRIEVLEQVVTDDEVRLLVATRHPPRTLGDCLQAPDTTLTLPLPEPLGDRRVVDAALLPHEDVPVGLP
ncbi:hypothetical protein [Egicoccus sp. AB-alg2]|uniref:hypothetical protein n=1 Tax=Egicoccus sp. AB-alg2 TaxID=3242693 RepID=UPI00359EC8B2